MNDARSEPLPNASGKATSPETACAISPDRGDVTTVRAADYVKLQDDKRAENLQSHSPSHRTAGTADLPSQASTKR